MLPLWTADPHFSTKDQKCLEEDVVKSSSDDSRVFNEDLGNHSNSDDKIEFEATKTNFESGDQEKKADVNAANEGNSTSSSNTVNTAKPNVSAAGNDSTIENKDGDFLWDQEMPDLENIYPDTNDEVLGA